MILESVRKTNEFFRNATRADIDRVLSSIVLSERQVEIFDSYYIKKKDIGFIADTLCVSMPVIKRELHKIREKILAVI